MATTDVCPTRVLDARADRPDGRTCAARRRQASLPVGPARLSTRAPSSSMGSRCRRRWQSKLESAEVATFGARSILGPMRTAQHCVGGRRRKPSANGLAGLHQVSTEALWPCSGWRTSVKSAGLARSPSRDRPAVADLGDSRGDRCKQPEVSEPGAGDERRHGDPVGHRSEPVRPTSQLSPELKRRRDPQTPAGPDRLPRARRNPLPPSTSTAAASSRPSRSSDPKRGHQSSSEGRR